MLLGGTCQDKHCYIVANGKNVVGRVAVWRNPAVLPSDLETWEAIEWPREQWAVPNNCIVCSVLGAGVTALAGGDSDGDEVFATLNQDLVEFLEHTEAAVRTLDLAAASKPRKELVEEQRKCFSLRPDPTGEYIQHVLSVPTPNVRGQATAMAERCQQALLGNPDRQDLRDLMLRVGSLCHAAYDCPKKFSGEYVLMAIRGQMQAAKLSATQYPRSTWAGVFELASTGLPAYTRKPWTLVNLEKLRDADIPLGQVYLPSAASRVVLGKAAGQWVRPIWRSMKRYWRLAWRRESGTCPLVEIACFLHHKCGRASTRRELELTSEDVTVLQEALKRAHFGRDIDTLRALLDSTFF